MSASFTSHLRVGRPPVRLGGDGGSLTFRVQAADLWDSVRIVASPETRLSEVKQRALAALLPEADPTDDYVLKLRGWEMLDHESMLKDAGVVEGAILLLAHRRRRPVR